MIFKIYHYNLTTDVLSKPINYDNTNEIKNGALGLTDIYDMLFTQIIGQMQWKKSDRILQFCVDDVPIYGFLFVNGKHDNNFRVTMGNMGNYPLNYKFIITNLRTNEEQYHCFHQIEKNKEKSYDLLACGLMGLGFGGILGILYSKYFP